MSQTLHPIQTTEQLRQAYISYLKTIKPFQDVRLGQEFARALEESDLLIKGPYLEITPPYEFGRSIRDLVREGILSSKFERLCHPNGLDFDRLLYQHQEEAVRKVLRGRNIVVTTGTGSGKTETFLIPILNSLLVEEENGTLSKPGVRALLLYPMNALANDQMERLRSVLQYYPTITFGRYIGDTEHSEQKAKDQYHQMNRASRFPEPLPNELLSRERMQEKPPHILLTNYAMLEYLLLRPADSPLFDGDTGKHWRFIVLDEAHVYDGAQGTEIAMLLRRLQQRVSHKSYKPLQAIATSATLGDENPESLEKIAQFATQMFNLCFEWVAEDPDRQDVILGKLMPESKLGEIWGQGSPPLYDQLARLADAWREDQIDIPLPNSLPGVPQLIIESAHRAALSEREFAIPVFLNSILRGDRNLHTLWAELRQAPCRFDKIAHIIFPEESDSEGQSSLANLVSAAILAREKPNTAPLLPARYHLFARALEGAFVCLYTSSPEHRGDSSKPSLFLRRQKFCPHCGSRVFELANCTRCGAVYLIGDVTPGEVLVGESFVQPHLEYLTQNSILYANDLEAKRVSYFSIEDSITELDEDALIEERAESEAVEQSEQLALLKLCIKCGALVDSHSSRRCNCQAPTLQLAQIETGKGRTLRRCTSCSTYSKSGVIYRFLTGQDAPVSVLAGTLYEHVPVARREEDRQHPGEGRKMLIFSDNRQQAAFFAAFFERVHERILHRRLIVEMLRQQSCAGNFLRFSDCLPPLLTLAEQYQIFAERESLKNKRIEIATWLMQEFSGIDRQISLEGVGLIYFRPVLRENWKPPQILSQDPWSLSESEAYTLITLLLNTLRRQGAVSYLLNNEKIDLLTERRSAFLPRARPFYVREHDAKSRYKYGIYSWMPAEGKNNSRLDYINRLLKKLCPQMLAEQIRHSSEQLLHEIWVHLTGTSSVVNEWWLCRHKDNEEGILYYLAHELWEVIPTLDLSEVSQWFICNRCQNLTPYHLANVCPTFGCSGRLELLVNYRNRVETNLYRHQYLKNVIVPMRTEEHTAQWKPQKAAEVQKEFISGRTNVLSSSTTFELGVDVGDLNAVVLRNMPPSSANYIQRAGRAGRRTDSVALVVTFAQRRPHDLTFYEYPERMIAGKIRPPVIALKNDKIIRRHMHSVAFSAFFRYAKNALQQTYRTTGDFFEQSDGLYGPLLLQNYLAQQPKEVEDALEYVVPKDMELCQALKLANWEWVSLLVGEEDALLDKAAQIVQSELNEFRRLEMEASQKRDYDQALRYKEIQEQISNRDLLGYLGSNNILPKYGFPTDVVKLQTDHLRIQSAADLELERDLQIAISEFAPGGNVMAAKRIWYSIGVIKRPNKLWPPYRYAICPSCQRMNIAVTEQSIERCICGRLLQGKQQIFIIPEHGFIASPHTDPAGERPIERIYASRVFFSHYTIQPNSLAKENEDTSELTTDTDFNSSVMVSKKYSRYGWLARVNNGYGNGFQICTKCGYANVISARTRRSIEPHKNPITQEKCSGTLMVYHLGYRFMTDVLEIRLSLSFQEEKMILSFLYALLHGAVDALNIPLNDVGGVFYYQDEVPCFILYDNTPGGAGYVHIIHNHLRDVFEAAYQRVSNCNGCAIDTSCYACLRNYQNQYIHDKLERRLAWEVLGKVLNKAMP
jgi:ATP-dependent helicase YprA (DUF1998 family)